MAINLFLLRKHAADVQADGFNFDGSYSSLDVEAVDMIKFPRMRNIPW